jgi:ComF family protein
VHALKFSYAKEAAEAIAAEITAALPLLSPDTVIVHAPAATSHVRMRGFDQSALIARAVARRLRLPHVHVLARMGQQRQVGSSGAVRREQMKDAFRVISPIVDGIPVLLIDDVLTTGSTLEAAAIALKRAGALRVDAATFAKAR